ncbi:MAG: hypothetical protein ABL876_17010 [Chitinophagaceae bacterium]
MTVVVPKNASKKQVQEALKKVRTGIKKKKSKGNVAHLFGSNPKEADGLAFQKKVRKEWD